MGSAMESPTKWGLYDRDAFEHWVDGRVCLVGDAAHPMLPTFGQGASQAFEDGAALGSCLKLHGRDINTALVHYERVRHYRATRLQYSSKMAFKNLQPKDSEARRQILESINERDFPTFFHDDRSGNDDSWIYEYDARDVGDTLPLRRLGPWDFRKGEAAAAAKEKVARNLWKPAQPHTSDRKVTREELERHSTFEDCWVIIRGKVYDFSKWKDHHPGGSFVARFYAGKDATAEFGQFHSARAEEHMKYFCVGDYVG
jgi:salicylate hydroxylase